MENAFLVPILVISFIGFMPTFAQEQVGNDLNNLIEGGVNEVSNQFKNNIDLSSGNPLNVTQEETDKLTDSGKGLFFAIFDLFKATHEFAVSMINFLSPYPVQAIIIFVVAGAISLIVALSILKRLAMHIFVLILVALAIVAIFVIFYF